MDDRDKKATIERSQKMFSGNISHSKVEGISTTVVSGAWDSELTNNLEPICALLYRISGDDSFFKLLARKMSRRFFSAEEINTSLILIAEEKYCQFLLTKN